LIGFGQSFPYEKKAISYLVLVKEEYQMNISTYPNFDVVELRSVGSDLFVRHFGYLRHLNVQVLSERNIICLRVIDLLEDLLAGLNNNPGWLVL
jgi:hypothetical protein